MRALVLVALATAAAAGAGTDSVNLGAGGGEPTPVKDGDKLRAALAKGDPIIELWDDILLEGAPAVAFHDAVIEGNNHVIYQTGGARHFVSNGTRLELKNLRLATGGHPSPAPTCSPTSPDATVAPTLHREAPLTLQSIEEAGLGDCGDLEKTENGIVVANFYAKNGGGVMATNDSVLLEALDVFDGDLTCCHHKHNRGDVCDKEALMLPMLGLYADL